MLLPGFVSASSPTVLLPAACLPQDDEAGASKKAAQEAAMIQGGRLMVRQGLKNDAGSEDEDGG